MFDCAAVAEKVRKCGKISYMKEDLDKDDEVSEITEFNAASESFAWLADEPEIYSRKNLKVVYPKPAD